MPIRMTAKEIDELEAEALRRGGTSSRHVVSLPLPQAEAAPDPPTPRRTRQTPPPTQQTASAEVPTATLFVPNWMPPSLNKIMEGHWSNAGKIKKQVAQIVDAMAKVQGTPKATGRRRVDVHIVAPKGQRRFDEDNVWKAVLDAVKHAGLIVDDSPNWRERGAVTWSRSLDGFVGTFILLTDR